MLSGPMRMAAKGRLDMLRARRWMRRQVSMAEEICSGVGLGGRGGNIVDSAMVCAG